MNTLLQITIAIIVIAFVTNIAVEIEKKVFTKFPSNILAIVTATVVTILSFVAYASYSNMVIELYVIIGVIAVCIAESYIAMFGYDKFVQTVKQYKSYIDDANK
jgi:hypothetical protein